jgi:hypothetical protein
MINPQKKQDHERMAVAVKNEIAKNEALLETLTRVCRILVGGSFF